MLLRVARRGLLVGDTIDEGQGRELLVRCPALTQLQEFDLCPDALQENRVRRRLSRKGVPRCGLGKGLARYKP